jgi:RND family efflux transporter MFP subunit
MKPARWSGAAVFWCLAVLGCGGPPPEKPRPKAPEIVVSFPVVKEVTDYEIFTGWTEAAQSVDIRARVTGYLEEGLREKHKEGWDVKEGELLFKIDPRIYQAERDRAKAAFEQSQAHLARLELDYRRAAGLLPSQAISQEDFDKIDGDRKEAEAAVATAQAALELAELNLKFTEVTSPFDGRVSRQAIDPQNIVKADDTVLTTIVALDPIYVYFDVDERTMLRVRRLILEGKVKSSREATMPVFAGLADEVDEKGEPLFPHAGTVNFVDNRVDRGAGTLRLRGEFPNPRSQFSANRIFSPGMFVRVRLPIGKPHTAVLISERALLTDQGQSFVYVVNEKDEVVYRRVTLGLLQDGLRVVEQGLAPGQRVVVDGLQRIQAGATVEPKLAEMPAPGGAAAPLVGASSSRPSS